MREIYFDFEAAEQILSEQKCWRWIFVVFVPFVLFDLLIVVARIFWKIDFSTVSGKVQRLSYTYLALRELGTPLAILQPAYGTIASRSAVTEYKRNDAATTFEFKGTVVERPVKMTGEIKFSSLRPSALDTAFRSTRIACLIASYPAGVDVGYDNGKLLYLARISPEALQPKEVEQSVQKALNRLRITLTALGAFNLIVAMSVAAYFVAAVDCWLGTNYVPSTNSQKSVLCLCAFVKNNEWEAICRNLPYCS